MMAILGQGAGGKSARVEVEVGGRGRATDRCVIARAPLPSTPLPSPVGLKSHKKPSPRRAALHRGAETIAKDAEDFEADSGVARAARYTDDAGDHEIVDVSDATCPVPADLPGDDGRSISLQTRQSRGGCTSRRHGQILFGTEALHQPHHTAEVWKAIQPRDTDLRSLLAGKHRKHP